MCAPGVTPPSEILLGTVTAVGQGLDFGLLGPLEVRRAGAVLDPGRRRQRLLLIRLLLADGLAVSPQTLCEELWPQQPGRAPCAALSSLHAHISKVRATLEPQHLRRQGAFEMLVTEPLGYALRVPPENRDTVRFERSVAQTHRLMDQGRPDRVVEEAQKALDMWRGTAFADAAHHLFAVQETARLEELRQTTREIRTTGLLLQGRITEALNAAQEITAQHPCGKPAGPCCCEPCTSPAGTPKRCSATPTCAGTSPTSSASNRARLYAPCTRASSTMTCRPCTRPTGRPTR